MIGLWPKMKCEQFPERYSCWVCGSPRAARLSETFLKILGIGDDHLDEIGVYVVEMEGGIDTARIQNTVSHVVQCPHLRE